MLPLKSNVVPALNIMLPEACSRIFAWPAYDDNVDDVMVRLAPRTVVAAVEIKASVQKTILTTGRILLALKHEPEGK